MTPSFITQLLLLSFPSCLLATKYRNDTRSCSGVTNDLRSYTGIDLRWIPTPNYQCVLTLRFSSSVSLTVLHQSTNGEDYRFSSECYRMSSSWICPTDCVGLFYSTRMLSDDPIGIRYMSVLSGVESGFLRLLYCSGRISRSYFHITSSPKLSGAGGEDPVWRILGPVLATVCIMAAIFLVCVCYAQNFYRREATCCPSFHRHVRRFFNCESTERSTPARVNPDTEASEVTTPPCRFVPPHIAAADMLAEEDRPPCYDDFHKYHRRDSFVCPPTYADAVASYLRPEADLGVIEGMGRGPGIDNEAFLPEVGLNDVTVEVDLADGSRLSAAEPSAEAEGDSHC